MILVLAKFIGVAFVGGVLTSAAEYYIKYSIYDLLKDKIIALVHKKPVVK